MLVPSSHSVRIIELLSIAALVTLVRSRAGKDCTVIHRDAIVADGYDSICTEETVVLQVSDGAESYTVRTIHYAALDRHLAVVRYCHITSDVCKGLEPVHSPQIRDIREDKVSADSLQFHTIEEIQLAIGKVFDNEVSSDLFQGLELVAVKEVSGSYKLEVSAYLLDGLEPVPVVEQKLRAVFKYQVAFNLVYNLESVRIDCTGYVPEYNTSIEDLVMYHC